MADSKVLFRVVEEDGSVQVETLWASALGGDRYQLDNSPFYAYGVSWRDVVNAPYDDEEGLPTFKSVVTKSGHRTIRIAFETPIEPGTAQDSLLQALVAMGCSYEGAHGRTLSVDVPKEVELQAVRAYLIDQHAVWEHADPTYDELFPHGG